MYSSNLKSGNQYFASGSSDDCISFLMARVAFWFNKYQQNNLLYKIRKSWEYYHGSFYGEAHDVSFGGEQGELVNLPVNDYGNIAQNMLNIITANRPAFQTRATNLDSRSEIQTVLASGLLEYYMREKRLERLLRKAAEYAIVLSAGFIKLDWNATSGKIYDYIEPEPKYDVDGNPLPAINPETGEPEKGIPLYEGDVEFELLSPFDIIYDSSKEYYEQNEWVLIRTFKNKYSLAAKYPQLADKILEVATKSTLQKTFIVQQFNESSDIPVYEFRHVQNEALPGGRLLVFINDEMVLSDTGLPFKDLNVFRITPRDFLGTPFGYTPMFDLIPLQSEQNSLFSAIATNQNAFNVQSIANPRGNDVRVQHIEGLNWIDYQPIPNAPNGGMPTPLNLVASSPETFNFSGLIGQKMEIISGMNPVVRGQIPDVSKISGNALALLQSQAIQFMSGLQQSYIQLIEDTGTGLIRLLKQFANQPRIAAIVGNDNRIKLKEFTGDDLEAVDRVIVDVSNPLAATTAGRVSMAEQLLQMKLIDTPAKYFEVMNTGKLSAMTDSENNKMIVIRSENEHLLNGDLEVRALITDLHPDHICEHRTVLDDPRLRYEAPDVIKRVQDHILEHFNLLKSADPQLLAIIGVQGIQPQQPQVPVSAGSPAESMMNQQAAGAGQGILQPNVPGATPKQLLPNVARPPKGESING